MKSYDIVCFQSNYWDDLWQSRHHVMLRLAKRHRVLFISPPFRLADLLSIGSTKSKRRDGLSKINANFYVYVPSKFFPVNHRFKTLNRISSSFRILVIKKILRDLRFQNIVLYLWRPEYVNMIGKFNEKFICYHVDDQYSGLTDNPSLTLRLEKELLRKADLVVTTSKNLFENKRIYNKKTYLIPNGVDYDLFSCEINDNESAHDLESIPTPRLGFSGNINSKVNLKLLRKVALVRPNWSIVLVGPISDKKDSYYDDFLSLLELKNVYYLGRKSIEVLPNYIKGFTVCMLPYYVNDYTKYIYPLKMHEYFACGKPVISSDIPAVYEFDTVVRIAGSVQDWVVAIEKSLTENNCMLAQERRQIAKANSWNRRVQQIEELINLIKKNDNS